MPRVLTERWFHCYDTPRGDLFTAESNRHPAKMAVGLCFRIFEHGEKRGYWEKGDTILDPMCGIGTTLICGAVLGYRCIGVELEGHFVELAWENVRYLAGKHLAERVAATQISIVQGDARQLSDLLANGCITSPPYAETMSSDSPGGIDWTKQKDGRTVSRPHSQGKIPNSYNAAVASPPYPSVFREEHPGTEGGQVALESERGGSFRGYSGVVASPPYGDLAVIQGAGVTHNILKTARERGMAAAVKLYRETVIDRLKAHGRWSDANIERHIEMALATAKDGGYGAVLSSPPYGGPVAHWEGQDPHPERTHSAIPSPSYGKNGAQIGNLRDPAGDIDAVLSSPPFSQEVNRDWHTEKYWNKDGNHPGGLPVERNYGSSEGQIEMLRDETYLAAMLQVYQQMRAVLKPSGVVCLVTKNPVRDGKIRRLDEDTIRLMDAAGFVFLERQMAMLASEHGEQLTLEGASELIRVERKSFFKRLFERKYPHLRVDNEDVLWFRKESHGEPRTF